MRTSAALVLLTAAAFAQHDAQPAWRGGREVAVRVGDVAITRDDLRAETDRKLPFRFHAKPDSTQMAQARRDALAGIVERTLVWVDAKARGIVASDEEVDAAFSRALEQAGPEFRNVDTEARKKLLEQNREAVVRRVLVDANEARFRASVAPIDQAELRKLYEERRAELNSPARARLRHVLVAVPPAASDREAAELRQRAQAARDAIAGGRPFADVARESSADIYAQQGGDLGVVERGTMRYREIEAAAFELAPGELSQVLTSMYGFHVVQCVERTLPQPLTFEAAAPLLESSLAAERLATARNEWMRELRQKHAVRVEAQDWATIQPAEWTPAKDASAK
jgi:hypothetical protein